MSLAYSERLQCLNTPCTSPIALCKGAELALVRMK